MGEFLLQPSLKSVDFVVYMLKDKFLKLLFIYSYNLLFISCILLLRCDFIEKKLIDY